MNHYKVASEYLDRFGSLDGELADFVFNPIYFPPEDYDYSFSGKTPFLPD